ncbi:MAG TPA: hypothetical protein VGK82_15460 [Pyrinomonadaceae bacterium]
MGRIVVNIDPATGPAARRQPKRGRRWLRILAILALVVVACIVVVALAGFFSWRRFQASPEYSLALLVDAAQHNNADELANLIDDDEIIRNMVGRVSQKTTERFGLAMPAATKQAVDQVVSSSSPQLKQAIHNEVSNELKTLAASSEPKPFFVLLLTVSSLVKVTTEGDSARATASVNNRNVELMMRRDADRWKLVGVNDDALVQRVVDGVMKDLPPVGGFDANSPLLKNLGRPRKRNR